MVDVISDTIDYQNEVGRREEQATHNAQESVNRQAWSTILDHWDVSEYEANYTVVRDWCNGEITVEKFQALLETNPPGLTLDWKGTRNKIIQEIAGLLEDPTGRRMTALDLKKAVASMQYWPKARLRARLTELKFKQGKTANDARALLVEHRRAERAENPYHPYEQMPAEITREVYRAASTQQILIWNRRFGQEQVRARLNGLA